ncbi:MAG: RelE protein [Nitrosarchaeum sp.]|nr:RelE protein [Nitrosarchaeum sp.]
MKWTAIWSPRAQIELDKLPPEDIKRILKKTDDVEENPFLYLERLINSPFFKFRVGYYRIIVDVVNDKLMLHLLKVKKRSRVYD